MRPGILPDGTVALPCGATTVEVEIPELKLTPAQRAHEEAIWAAHEAVERAIGDEAIRAAVADLCRLIRTRDQQVMLALEDARLCRVFDVLRGKGVQ